MASDSSSSLAESRPRQFAQKRARLTYQALLQAAIDTFGEKGYDATQTPDIAAAAGVSVGTFYRYFTDKHEIFLEVMRAHLEEGQQLVISQLSPDRFGPGSQRATIEQALGVLLDAVTRDIKLEREFVAMSLRDPQVAALRRQMEESARAQIAALIAAICTRDQVSDPDAMAFIITTAASECAMHIGTIRGESGIGRERAMRALSLLVHRALFGTTSE